MIKDLANETLSVAEVVYSVSVGKGAAGPRVGFLHEAEPSMGTNESISVIPKTPLRLFGRVARLNAVQ